MPEGDTRGVVELGVSNRTDVMKEKNIPLQKGTLNTRVLRSNLAFASFSFFLFSFSPFSIINGLLFKLSRDE